MAEIRVEYWTDDHGNLGERLTDADLARLAGQLDVARQQGYYFKVYMPCGVSEHRHRWALTAWLCRLVKGD